MCIWSRVSRFSLAREKRRVGERNSDTRTISLREVEAVTSGGPMIHSTRKMYHGATCVALLSRSRSWQLLEASNRSSSRLFLPTTFAAVVCVRFTSRGVLYFAIDVFADRDVHQVRGRVHGRGLRVRLVERTYTKRAIE